jgi:hypothetical protein
MLKLLQNIIPELFGKKLPTPVYSLLSEDEYLRNEEVFDCTCGRK